MSGTTSKDIKAFMDGLTHAQFHDVLAVQIARAGAEAARDARLYGSLLVTTLRIAGHRDVAKGIENTLKTIGV